MSRSPHEALPLKAVDFHILLVLTDGELHGYGMVREIERRSEGRIRLEPGNLYRYLRRLVDEGMVEPAERRAAGHTVEPDPVASEDRGSGRGDAVRSPRSRRYYRVTAYGRQVLAADAARMRTLARAVERGLQGVD